MLWKCFAASAENATRSEKVTRELPLFSVVPLNQIYVTNGRMFRSLKGCWKSENPELMNHKFQESRSHKLPGRADTSYRKINRSSRFTGRSREVTEKLCNKSSMISYKAMTPLNLLQFSCFQNSKLP